MPKEQLQSSPSLFSKFFSTLFSSPKPGSAAQSQVRNLKTYSNQKKKTGVRRDYTKAIFEVLPDLLFVFDRKGNFIDYKPAHFGGPALPAKNFLGKNIAEVLPMHVTMVSLLAMQQVFQKGGVQVIEYEGIVEGKEHVFEGRYIALSKSQALAIIRDITDRKEIEERLEQRNFEMSTLIENLLTGVIMEDETRTVTHANDEFVKLFKLSGSAESFEHQNGVQFIQRIAEQCQEPTRFIKRVDEIAHALVRVTDEEWELKDGRIVQLEYMPICHEGICRGHLWMYRDITEHKKIDQMKTDFISIASHQLRTPLTGIRWVSELLLKGKAGDLTKEQCELMEQLFETNQRMVALVNDLLDVSRIELGKIENLEMVPGDVCSLVLSVIEEVKPLAQKKSSAISFEVNQKIVVRYDAERLRQVFVNILSNAIKYSPAKSVIEVGIKKVKDEVVFSCRDQGIGIPSSDHGRLFEKFFRASNALKYEAEGTGLGLYIARSITEKHGGRIWFETPKSGGTIFYVALPRMKKSS